jgi:hypothetical protein
LVPTTTEIARRGSGALASMAEASESEASDKNASILGAFVPPARGLRLVVARHRRAGRRGRQVDQSAPRAATGSADD